VDIYYPANGRPYPTPRRLWYTAYMPSNHVILEVRTGRDSEHTPEAAVQLFGNLPHLHTHLGHKVLGRDEHLSLEIVAWHQTVYFLCSVPERLAEYVKGLIMASYPEALVTPLEVDPVDVLINHLQHPSDPQAGVTHSVSVGSLQLKHQEYLPLKTFVDIKELDSLSALLSTLSASEPQDHIVIQLVLNDEGDGWKRAGHRQLEATRTAGQTHPQQALIDRKLATRGLRVGIKVGVSAASSERSQLLLESISATFQSTSQSEGNVLVLRKPFFFKGKFLQSMKKRSFGFSPKQHLSLEELATLYHLPNAKLATIPNLAWGKTLFSQPPDDLPIITRETDPDAKREINVFAQTLYKNALATYGLKRADRRRHLYVIGKTGTGKSTLLANMAINDLKNDEGLCVIDPHGDLVETILNYIPSRRINDVVYFDPSDPERTVKINLFEGENVAHRELIASGIVSIFQKLYAYSWGPRLEYILRNALLTLLKSDQARLSDITDLLTDAKFRAKVIENLDDPILKNFWVNEFDALQDRQRNEAVAPILNKVGQFVSSPLIRDVVNSHKSSFSIEDIMSQGKILLVNLSQGKLGEDNATLLGAMMITKIQLAAMARVNTPEEERRDFYLYVDEFQNFATQSFNKILSEARKYRLNLTLANQYIAQIPEDVQKAIFGNCGSMVSFVMGADDAGVFSKEFAGKYSTEDLVSLGRYQVVNKVSIDNVVSLPFTGQTLSLAKSSNQNKDKVIRVSRERWATKKK
jgi:hypothetical protein